jgi:cytochrome c oxidase subunit 4
MSSHSDGHSENTGHGTHHVFSDKMLKTTFAILCGLTLLTVVLALMERGYGDFFGTRFPMPKVEFGALSVPIALGIASIKAYFVAANFMGLRHDSPTYRLVFIGTLIFLLIFFSFTFLDFRFRDTFEAMSAIPVDIEQQQVLAAQAEQDSIQAAYDAAPLVDRPDSLLFGRISSAPQGTPAPAGPDTAIPGTVDGTDALGGSPATGPGN